MKAWWKAWALCTVILVWPLSAWADFSGAYAPAGWTTTLAGTPSGGGGGVNASGAPASIVLNGGDTLCPDTGSCYVEYTITAPADTTVSFDWSYVSADVDVAESDLFSFVRDGTLFQLSDNGGSATQSGNQSFSATAGQVFGFRLNCRDCIFGAATVTISNFNVSPASGSAAGIRPVPTLQKGALIAMATMIGLLVLVAFRRERQG